MMKQSFNGLFVALGVITLAVISTQTNHHHDADIEDNEFAEFEEFDEENTESESETENTASFQQPQNQKSPDVEWHSDTADDEDATVETEDDEFEHFQDDEEFEGFDKDRTPGKGKSQEAPPALKISKIPYHLRTNWDSFYMEMLMLAGLSAYFFNFLTGKAKNNRLAQSWLNAHRDLLDANFSIVGDDGTSKDVQQSGVLIKESENIYALWCSGRVCVEGMLVELKLIKRQDLVNTIARAFKPASDQIVITVNMDVGCMDKFVFVLAQRKICSKLQRDMYDLSQFCQERKSADRYGLPAYQILSEIGEVTPMLLDKKMSQVLTKYEGLVEYIHFSDQYSGPKIQEESQPQKMPAAKPVLIFCFNVPGRGKSNTNDMEAIKPLMQMVFHCIDKISRLQLNKEGRQKAERNRQKAEEAFLKSAHAQRQEAAQQRREVKRRAEKEKIMNEDDPDKTRKWEERESRREMKKKQPKMKMMKIKAM